MCSIVGGIRGTVGSAASSTGFRVIKAVPPPPSTSSRVLRSSLQVVGPWPVMKATTGGSGGLLFSDQLKQIVTWFDGWNDCDQTVALCSLLKRLGPLQGRFLTHCLQSFHVDSFELPLLENRANSCEYLESLHGLNPDIVITHLLQHLPLLRPGHDEIRARYLALIQDVLSYAIETRTFYVECRQILSYSLMHPAFTAGDRTALKRWTQRLEYFTTGNFGHVNSTTSPTAVVPTSNGTNHVNGCGALSNGHDHQSRQQQQQSNATNKAPSVYGGQVSSQPPTVHQQVPVSRLDNWTNGSSVNEAPHSPPRLVSASSVDTMLSAFNGSVRSTSIGGGAELHDSGTNNYADTDAVKQLSVRLNAVSFFTPTQTESDVTNNMIDLNNSYGPSAQGNGSLNGRSKRSNSLTPPSSLSSSSSLSSIQNGGGCNGFAGLCGQLAAEESGRVKPRSMSLSSCSGPLSPQSKLGSSAYNSEGHLEDYNFDNVGMKVIPTWLKGLRLHKYKGIFSRLTYDQIFEMTEASLTAQGVTKGARDKIILSIQKLRFRQDLLRSQEEMLQDGGSIRNALLAVGGVIDSPLIPFQPDAYVANESDETSAISEGNLPGQITRFFGKISLQLLKRPLEEDSMHQFLDLIDKCLNHEAFSDSQKRRLTVLYQQVREECRSPRRGSDYRHNRGRLNRNSGGGFGGVGSGQVRLGSYANGGSPNHNQYVLEQRRTSGPVVLQSTKSSSADNTDYFHHEQQQQRRSSLAVTVNRDFSRSPPPPMISVDHPLLLNNQLSIPSLYNKRGSLQENNSHTLLVRAKSAPDPHNQYQLFGNGKSGGSGIINTNTENDFINGLESVSRSVTEHALGDSG